MEPSMDERYSIENTSQVLSPGLVVFSDILTENLEQMIEIAGDPRRLRPHCKTHKMARVVQMQLSRGITKHKCATFAEAEMLALAGVKDILLAYNLVGPNIARAVQFVQKYSDVTFIVTADHAIPIAALGQAMVESKQRIQVMLDLDTGQHRTGVCDAQEAHQLYGAIAETAGLIAGGLHVYDGQNHQTPLVERRHAVNACWDQARKLRDALVGDGYEVPRIVAGGTGSFPIYAAQEDATIELSPGTCVFQDVGYGEHFPDLTFTPAALILTRVISRPTDNRVTFDLGYKAVASDPPAGSRLVFPAIPDAREVLQNEEHLVIETSQAANFLPGDEELAIPRHICPTSALHKEAWMVAGGKVVERWTVDARDRRLSI